MNYWVDFLRNDNGNVWDNILIEFFNTTDFSQTANVKLN